jgi:putative tryptophan/tyrosine transport system substrate-binding protein
MRRRDVIVLFSGLAASVCSSLPLNAQQILRVGWLYPGPTIAAPRRLEAFTDGLRDSGFRVPDDVEVLPGIGEDDMDRLEPLARDFVDRKVDVILAISPAAINAAVKVTRSAGTGVPIVAMSFETDPVESGLVESLAWPGGNVTGLFLAFSEFSIKWVELLKEAVPELSRVAVLWDPVTGTMQRTGVEAAARLFEVNLDLLAVRSRDDLDGAFATARQGSADAVLMLSSPIFGANSKLAAELALLHRLPAVSLFTEFPRVGGLIAYGPDLFDAYRHAAGIAARILRGSDPAELPVELYSRYELVVNLATARALGVTIPRSILIRANEVID